jgi:stress response protein YsnF
MKTIIAAFCDEAAAQQAITFLQSRGVRDVDLVASPVGGDLMSRLQGFRIPDERAQLYAEVARRGSPIVIAHADNDARDIARELDQMGSLDLDSAAKRWRSQGWNGFDASAIPYDADACARERTLLMGESGIAERDISARRDVDTTAGRDLDVIEERVVVGKREVERGGVRVRTFVAERPVEEQVQLTEERVDVSRERVDEPISPQGLDATLTEDEFVVTARGEEAVVGKEARVVERVHVGKTADTRTETVRETERRRDVEVEPIDEGVDRPHGTRR